MKKGILIKIIPSGCFLGFITVSFINGDISWVDNKDSRLGFIAASLIGCLVSITFLLIGED